VGPAGALTFSARVLPGHLPRRDRPGLQASGAQDRLQAADRDHGDNINFGKQSDFNFPGMDDDVSRPRISVLMPVYNGATYLQEALNSILSQTYSNFELIALYDNSSDSSMDILRACVDPRLVIFENEHKSGLAAVLNSGLAMAQGEFIARMDCDDISHPERFARQVAFLDANPDIAICGTWFRGINPSGALAGPAERPGTDPSSVYSINFFKSTLAHPTVMMRASALFENGLKYSEVEHTEDYDLWSRALVHCRIANIPEFLLLYRRHPHQSSNVHDKLWESTKQIRAKLLMAIGIQAEGMELDIHQQICASSFDVSKDFIQNADLWLCRILAANRISKVYPDLPFSRAIMERWSIIIFRALQQRVVHPRLLLRAKIMTETGLGTWYLFKYYSRMISHKLADACFNRLSSVAGMNRFGK